MIKSPRTSRFAAALVATCLLGLTACGNVLSSSDAFSVNGTGYSQDDFNKLADAFISEGGFTPVNGKISSTDAIVLLRILIRYEVFLKFIEDNDMKILSSDKDAVLKDAIGTDFAERKKEIQEAIINNNVLDRTLERMTPPTIGTIEKLYSDSPASVGVLCLSHILVKTEAAARTVLADLKSGATFAEVAAKKSIEPGADKSGGSLTGDDQQCLALEKLQVPSMDKDFLVGAVAAKPGVPTGPVKSSFGYHIIYSAPFADVKDSVATVVAQDPGNTLLAGYMSSADIKVSSKYGVWNGATATIS